LRASPKPQLSQEFYLRKVSYELKTKPSDTKTQNGYAILRFGITGFGAESQKT
jgi:hypothetical protein